MSQRKSQAQHGVKQMNKGIILVLGRATCDASMGQIVGSHCFRQSTPSSSRLSLWYHRKLFQNELGKYKIYKIFLPYFITLKKI